MTPLIDATEMYLRTVWELEEEGITPIRARLVERLQLSAPAVSETVARLEQEGLLRVHPDRTLQLTDAGRAIAVSVMRKHRLAERLLTDVIGLEWEQAHNEACRWEHVISDRVEQRLVEVLGDPETSPFGNPIRGLGRAPSWGAQTLSAAAKEAGSFSIEHISEHLQVDVEAMSFLHTHGLEPGAVIALAVDEGRVVADVQGRRVGVPAPVADLVYVERH